MPSVVPIYNSNDLVVNSAEEYEEALGLHYYPHLFFATPKVEKWVRKQCSKAEKKGEIDQEQKWLAAYYNAEIVNQSHPEIAVRWIDPFIGYGLFAEKKLHKRTFIGEYTGLLRKKRKRRDQKNSYTFQYLIGTTIDTPFTIDAKEGGNHTRFINHSFLGNCDPMLIYHQGIMRVIIYTNRRVEKGEQLTYDYGEEYWEKREDPTAIDSAKN